MLEKIRKQINKTMSEYTDSRHPTGDEVSIAWLVCEIDRLHDIIISNGLSLKDEPGTSKMMLKCFVCHKTGPTVTGYCESCGSANVKEV